MKKIILLIFGILLFNCNISTAEKVSINKQLIGVVGAVSGTVKTETRDLKTGDKIYLNETIFADSNSGTQILLLDQSTFTIGSESEVVMDTFIYDPDTNNGKIVANVKQGSLKVISGLISKKNPDSLTVKVPEGTLGSRGTEFQTNVTKKRTDTLLIGPGKNNTLGLRPGAVLVGNKHGKTMLNNPYSFTSMTKGTAPDQAKKVTQRQLKKFEKKMKALKVAKLQGVSKEEKKLIKKEIKKELKAVGLDKEEIKVLIKNNIKIDKEIKAEKKKLKKEKKNAKKQKTNELKINNKDIKEDGKVVKNKTITRKDGTVVQQKTVLNTKTGKITQTQKITKKDGTVTFKKREGVAKKTKVVKKKKPTNKKKAVKKKAADKKKSKAANNKGKKKKKKAVKKKPTNKKKAVKKKPPKNKKGVKKKPPPKKKKAVKKKPPKKKKAIKKKPPPKKKKVVKRKPPPKKKKVVKKKVAKKKKKAKNKRRRKK